MSATLAGPPALAHRASEAFLEIQVQSGITKVRWDIAIRDLDLLLDLDADGDGALQWSEVVHRKAAIADYASRRIALSAASGGCAGSPTVNSLARRDGSTYAVLRWYPACPHGEPVSGLQYRFLFGVDPNHRVIVSLPGGAVDLRALRASDETQLVDVSTRREGARRYDLAGFFMEGMRHILHGTDHLAFLLALLIPAISYAGVRANALGVTLGKLLKVVSVFTLAHSITLALTAMGLIGLPSRWVESIVALSVAAGGLQALLASRFAAGTPAPDERQARHVTSGEMPSWLVFAFGLIHGIGFGSALQGTGIGCEMLQGFANS
jgi:hypothetical protein